MYWQYRWYAIDFIAAQIGEKKKVWLVDNSCEYWNKSKPVIVAIVHIIVDNSVETENWVIVSILNLKPNHL